MMRVIPAAAMLLVLVPRAVPAQDSDSELALTHLAGEKEVATSRLFVSSAEIRAKGKFGATDLIALLQRDASGGFLRYDRELKSSRDGSLISSVSVVADDATLSFRERGQMGSRTKSVTGPTIDFVVDAAFPEAFIPYMLDDSRKSIRVLVLPELEIKTLVIEDRGDGGRYAPVPGGAVTLFRSAAGGFGRLVLPGPEGRVIVPAGTETRPAPSTAHETRIVLNQGQGARVAFTLALPPTGTGPFPAVVLLGDAGPRDRNGVGGGSLIPTLKLLSEELAARGIASLRADKRGVGESTGVEPGLAALVHDARSLVDAAALHPAIDRGRIFVAGHGEGAIVATELGRTAGDKVQGIVTLAGPARPLPEALEARLRVRLSAAGQLPEAIDGAVAALRREMEALRVLPESGPVGPGQALLRDLVRIDPAVLVAAAQAPLLIVHAADDRETPAAQVALMRASLAFSADRARFEIVDGADHDLLESPKAAAFTRTEPGAADVARSLHPRIPALIGDFIERTQAAPSKPSPR